MRRLFGVLFLAHAHVCLFIHKEPLGWAALWAVLLSRNCWVERSPFPKDLRGIPMSFPLITRLPAPHPFPFALQCQPSRHTLWTFLCVSSSRLVVKWALKVSLTALWRWCLMEQLVILGAVIEEWQQEGFQVAEGSYHIRKEPDFPPNPKDSVCLKTILVWYLSFRITQRNYSQAAGLNNSFIFHNTFGCKCCSIDYVHSASWVIA